MWQALKAACLHSTTIAWSYFVAFAGIVLQGLDFLPDILNDSNLQSTIHNELGNEILWGRILLGIAIVNVLARLRTLKKVV